MPFSLSTNMLLILIIPIAWGNGINFPTLISMISKKSPEHERGLIMGITNSFGSLARIIGPLTGGFLFGNVHYSAPYLLGAGVMGGAFILSFFFLQKES